MTDLTEEERRIVSHLHEQVANGETYLRSHQIADAVGLTANQVGSRLARLAEKVEELEIEKWARSRSTTWRIKSA